MYLPRTSTILQVIVSERVILPVPARAGWGSSAAQRAAVARLVRRARPTGTAVNSLAVPMRCALDPAPAAQMEAACFRRQNVDREPVTARARARALASLASSGATACSRRLVTPTMSGRMPAQLVHCSVPPAPEVAEFALPVPSVAVLLSRKCAMRTAPGRIPDRLVEHVIPAP